MAHAFASRLAICVTLAASVGAVAATVGPDPNATPQETRQSLQKAIDGAAGGGEVVLKAGRYEIDQPLRMPSRITLRGEGDVTLSGSRRLQLDWRPTETKGVMRAQLPPELDLSNNACDQLYLNGERMALARFPNFSPTERFFGGTSADALSTARIASWRNPAGGLIHSLHRAEWGGNHWRIRGKKDNSTLDLEGGWMNNRPSGVNPERRFVENIREELDAPGEWFLDRERREVLLVPRPGVDLSTAEITLSGIESLIQIVGETPDAPIRDVRLRGLRFAGTSRTFMKTTEPLLRSDWMIHRGGAVFAENARDVQIEDCEFVRLGGNAVFVSGYAERVAVTGCHLTDLGASGVCFVGKPEAVRSPSFNYGQFVPFAELDREPGPKTEDYPRDCRVEDCLIHDIGTTEKQTAGVQISMAARITVRHVSVYDTPRAGINISEGTWGGHLIDWCDVFDTVLMTGDHGSFNSWGRDRFWHPNRGELDRITTESPELILLDAIETTIIRNSRWRCDHGWDIDLDDGSSNYHVYNNLCLQGGIKLREGFHRQVFNNITVNNSIHPHVWFNESHDRIERNVLMTWYRPIRVPVWGDRVDDNLLPDNAALARSRELGIDRRSVAGDPMFLNPAAGDFRVAKDSPALEIGFENFPMDRFGVQNPELRKIARTPVIPSLGIESKSDDTGEYTFLGATVKRLQGLGERSATGMDSERGVLVLSVPEGSPAERGRLQENDVLLRIGGFAVNHPTQLQDAYLRTESHDSCDFVLFRNQREQTVAVPGVLEVRLPATDAKCVGETGEPDYDRANGLLEVRLGDSGSLLWTPTIHGDITADIYLITDEANSARGDWVVELADQSGEATIGDDQRHHLGRVQFERYGAVPVRLRPNAGAGKAALRIRELILVTRK